MDTHSFGIRCWGPAKVYQTVVRFKLEVLEMGSNLSKEELKPSVQPCSKHCWICKLPMLHQNEREKRKHRGSDEYSWVTPRELVVDSSTVPEIEGFGVIARETIGQYVRIGNYEGELVAADDLDPTSNYVWDFECGNLAVDAEDKKHSNFLRYVNHHKKTRRNVTPEFHAPGGVPTVTYITSRPIKRGEELFVDYGPDYNNNLREQGFTTTTDEPLHAVFMKLLQVHERTENTKL